LKYHLTSYLTFYNYGEMPPCNAKNLLLTTHHKGNESKLVMNF